MKCVHEYMMQGFARAAAGRPAAERRMGAELKFPFVTVDGHAVSHDVVDRLWRCLKGHGWAGETDSADGHLIGARTPGEQNDTVASCETGFCKPEFSLAHVGDLDTLDRDIRRLRELLASFFEAEDVRMLGYGIQPLTPPSERLMMKKTRTSVWDKVFGANRCLAPEDGDDVCLFTVNAASHVHISVSADEAVRAVNVLNGFAGAQVALTANSPVWRGQVDPHHKCVSETFWDLWMPQADRVGVPPAPFENLADYVHAVAQLKPVYVKRDGRPILLPDYKRFADYYSAGTARGLTLTGEDVKLTPEPADIDLHSTCYWYTARISRYYTVENRANDQQPPGALTAVAALTLGLISALDEAWEEVRSHNWSDLRHSRKDACRFALAGACNSAPLADLSARMLDLARLGLGRRGRNEERFLEPLEQRTKTRRSPADEAIDLFTRGGIDALMKARRI